jgi:hypothetical protein
LAPHATEIFGDFQRFWTGGVVAKSGDGRVVFSAHLTWEELKAQDYRIVIEEQPNPP